ncbi:hypothetical protein [Mucilaginibacter sp. L196]|uniref:hypothetical protein n=1 Tax=Mucilaginibacter sp. L196 TaxID=1641870 RepID=UPI00131C7982|nr:hypothetical protein [Mucilaginibacter sp. L196]
MEAKLPDDESPDFSTLSGIMEYFNKVPFETFKKVLTEWFLKELPDKRPDLINPNGNANLPPSIANLIDGVFKLAEEKDLSKLN